MHKKLAFFLVPVTGCYMLAGIAVLDEILIFSIGLFVFLYRSEIKLPPLFNPLNLFLYIAFISSIIGTLFIATKSGRLVMLFGSLILLHQFIPKIMYSKGSHRALFYGILLICAIQVYLTGIFPHKTIDESVWAFQGTFWAGTAFTSYYISAGIVLAIFLARQHSENKFDQLFLALLIIGIQLKILFAISKSSSAVMDLPKGIKISLFLILLITFYQMFLGTQVREFIDDTDLVIILGSRLSYFPTGGWTLKFPGKVIQIDIDPAELGRNHPVHMGVVSDLKDAITRLNNHIESKKIKFNTSERKPEIKALIDKIHTALGKPVEVDVLDQLRSALPHESIVFNDPTTIVFWMRSYWKTYLPRTWFVPSGFGTLGFALPSAIGAKVAKPDVPVVAMHGDAGVMFTIQDLMTAVEHNIPVILFVFNDQGYGVERRHQDHLYGRRSGVDIQSPDFVGLAKSFGAHGVRVDDLSKVGEAVSEVLNINKPTLIEVPCDFKHPGYGSFIDWSKQ